MSSLLSKSSVISHPTRGEGGNNAYRGNAGANFMRDVIGFGIEHTKTQPNAFLFVDANEGSGTSKDVAKQIGCQYVWLQSQLKQKYKLENELKLLKSCESDKQELIDVLKDKAMMYKEMVDEYRKMRVLKVYV